MSNPKLALHELSMIKKILEDCIKAVDRAHAYVSSEQIQKIMGKEKSEPKDEVETMLEEVTAKAYSISNFDPSFVESLNSALRKYGKLTEKQLIALENLHKKLCQRKNQ